MNRFYAMSFFSNITIGQYAPGESFVHRLDPRFKTVILLVMIIQCFLLDKWWLLLAPLAFFALVSFLTGISFSFIMRGMRPILPFVLITFVFNALLTPGHPLLLYEYPSSFSFTPFPDMSVKAPVFDGLVVAVTAEGVDFGFFMSMRLLIIVLVASLFTLTTSPMEITDAMEYMLRWARPLGVPAHEIAMMMSIALRFIPTLSDQLDRIVKAQLSRGADFEAKSLVKKAKCFVPVLIPLFVNAFKIADDLAAAMEARGYRGGEGRTRLREMRATWRDGASVAWTALFCAALNYFQFFA